MEVELSLVELFSCLYCRKPFYLRLPVRDDEDEVHEVLIKEYVRCPECSGINEPQEQPVDHKFHYGFVCDVCGHENIRSSDVKPKVVQCICQREYEAAIPDGVLIWWSTSHKPVTVG